VANGAEDPAPCPIGQTLPQFFSKLDHWQKEFGSPMLIALSGGGDSMALCRMASQWAKITGAPLYVASVDHGLRPNSAADSAQAIAWARALGLSGEVVRAAGLGTTSALSGFSVCGTTRERQNDPRWPHLGRSG
jgi:tRNA(Ile)-lysidine synthase